MPSGPQYSPVPTTPLDAIVAGAVIAPIPDLTPLLRVRRVHLPFATVEPLSHSNAPSPVRIVQLSGTAWATVDPSLIEDAFPPPVPPVRHDTLHGSAQCESNDELIARLSAQYGIPLDDSLIKKFGTQPPSPPPPPAVR